MADGLFTRLVDNGDEGATIVRGQYVGDIVDDAKARHNEGHHGRSDWKHAARIPNVVIEHYLNVNRITMAEFVRNPEHIKRLCNSPEFSDLRIWPGKL